MSADYTLPPLPAAEFAEVIATAENTRAVRSGFEQGGYVKEPAKWSRAQIERHGTECAEAARAPLLARIKELDHRLLHRATKIEQQKARIAEMEVERAVLREVAGKASALLKRTPKATRDMYVGKDRVSWGRQAESVLKSLNTAMQESGDA